MIKKKSMRLIDVNKLTPIITHWNPVALIEESYYHEEQIINAPTVDAITIEWLENYIAEFRNRIEDFEKAGVGVYTSYKDELKGIVTMLQFWRKENE